VPAQENTQDDALLIGESGRLGNGQSAVATHAPLRKTQVPMSAAPAGDNFSEQDRQVVFSISEATDNCAKGKKHTSQGHEGNKPSMLSDLSPSCQIVSECESNLASSADGSTASRGQNIHPSDQPPTFQEPNRRPRELSIRNAARRLRANATRQDGLLPQDLAHNHSSTLVNTSVPSSTVSSTSEELATGKGAIVSAPSQPAFKVGPDHPRRCFIIESAKTGENSNSSDAGTGVEEARPSTASHVIAASDTKVSGATRSLDSLAVRGNEANEARLRLLRARITAGKELERTLTTNNNNNDVSNRAVPHETVSVPSLFAGTRTDTLAARADNAAPGTVASGDLAAETQRKPLSVEEAALRRVLVQRRASAAAGVSRPPS
jgi:hypothetical protein